MPLYFRNNKVRSLFWLVALLLIVGALLFAQQHRLYERLWFSIKSSHYSHEWSERSLWLNDYQVDIEAHPIEGVENLSALTYNHESNTLFTVTNKNPELIELSLDGGILRRVPLRGLDDAEAIEHLYGNTFVVADERKQRLIRFQLHKEAYEVDVNQFPQLTLSLGPKDNKGFEGLAYDMTSQSLLVARERDPIQIIRIQGFADEDESTDLVIETDPQRDQRLFIRDLSSLDVDRNTGHLLVLSDESHLLIELDRHDKPVSTLQLLRGQHGLNSSIPQAEGVATGPDGSVYLVSEPNLFYRFSAPAK